MQESQQRKLAVGLLPFFIFGISYDWMRVYPNYEVNPIDVRNLYDLEKFLFGIEENGTLLIPCEYFALHHSVIADILAGFFYLCWVPVPIAFGLWLYLKRQAFVSRFSIVFFIGKSNRIRGLLYSPCSTSLVCNKLRF